MPPHIKAMFEECPALAEAARYGVDIPLLLDNLNRPISERIRRLQAASDAIQCLRKKNSVKSGLLELLERLTQAEVPFVLVGDFATVVYTNISVSHPMEICCDFSLDNLLHIQKSMTGLNPVCRMTPERKPLELTPENITGLNNLYLDTDLGVLDCLSYVEGIGDFEQTSAASRKIDVDGMILNILTIDALIQAKEAMRRPQDQQAILQLKAIREQLNKNGK
jgi:hypothetical protein